jgi:endonuclease YncB( thermonuclease family)
MATPIIKGSFTTIRWGTTLANQATPFSTAIIKSIKASRLGGEPTKIEDNDGFTAIIVGLADGDKVEVEVVDDTSKTWPEQYDIASLKAPKASAVANFLIIDTGESLARKTEGSRTFTLEKYSAFAL